MGSAPEVGARDLVGGEAAEPHPPHLDQFSSRGLDGPIRSVDTANLFMLM
jgi:hypothetical protein